jgi:3-deoxy-D-manno-octulosonate 8-phosphate phosphatase (KDO 8-P phosphatase)
MSLNFKKLLRNVKAFAFDVDGVFSHNVLLHPSGEIMRSMNIKDGFSVQYAVKKGYPIAIITGGKCDSVRERFKNLGVTDIYLQSSNKIDDFEDFLSKYQIKPEDILYMGDDLPDYEIMKRVGVPTCPADAVEEIKSISVYVSHKTGGEGCVRDIIEQTLRVQGQWMHPEAFTW